MLMAGIWGVNLEPHGSLRVTLSQVSGQSEWPTLPPGAMATSKPGHLSWTMFGFMVLSLSGSVMSMAHGATKRHTDVQGFRPDPAAMLLSKSCAATGAMVSSGPCLGPWPYSSQGLCWYQWFVVPSKAIWMPRVWSTNCGHVRVCGPHYH